MTATPAGRPPATADVGPHCRQPGALTSGRWWDSRATGAAFAAALAALSAWVFTAGIGTPWPWNDEGATYLALLRDWNGLAVLSSGRDAPIVPYYFAAKAWTSALQWLWPEVSTLLALRLLSAAAATATVVVLYAIVARNLGRAGGLLAGLLLLSLPGLTRYAQEARTYALMALASSLAWLLWDRWMRPRVVVTMAGAALGTPQPNRLRAAGRHFGYAVGLAAPALLHTFGLFQWPAHALATAMAGGCEPRTARRRLVELLGVLLVASALVAWQVIASLNHGTGPLGAHAQRTVNAVTVAGQLLRGLSATRNPVTSAVIVLLAAVGVAAVWTRAHGRFATSMLIWLAVPLLGELTIGALRTNLFRARYLIADLPPVAALAAIGLVRLVALAGAVTARLPIIARRKAGGSSWPAILPRAASVALVAAVLSAQLGVTWRTQAQLRGPEGHGENLGGVLALIDRSRSRDAALPVLFPSRTGPGTFGAVEPRLERENPLRQVDPSSTTVYTARRPPAEIEQRLVGVRSALWIHPGAIDEAEAARRLPKSLRGLGFTVAWARSPSSRWTVVLLDSTRPG